MPGKKLVFDSVSLSNFAHSDSIYILQNRYRKRGIITREVYGELSAGVAEYPVLRFIDKLVNKKDFKLISLTNPEHELFLGLIRYLGKGEASCIAYASEHDATVVTDDRAARQQCHQMKIPVTGTIGILKAALLDGDIDKPEADALLIRMVKAGFYSPVRSISDIV
jgi:predicted nucleic acid-binding protein